MIGTDTSNAILFNFQPSGASALTVLADKLSQTGVTGSTQLAKHDSARILSIKDRFERAALAVQLPPALLAAMASRESRCGATLDSNGYGDNQHAFGILQIDKRYHTLQGVADPHSDAHICQASTLLNAFLQQITCHYPHWPAARQLQAAVVAYNAGVKNVKTLQGMDIGTTHNDYSNDVWARALYFAGH
ncbi:transglycosylase SLT domain-containing protein [Methylomonas sp. AM2-LC]|uniref:lysozyme n=1 Tax=Methylomonas sp. AM2-LC TaxID=3153301 RepID=UPI00326474C4